MFSAAVRLVLTVCRRRPAVRRCFRCHLSIEPRARPAVCGTLRFEHGIDLTSMAVQLPAWGPVQTWVGLSRAASQAAQQAARFTNEDPNDVELWQIEITTLGIGALVRIGWLTAFGSQHFRLFAGLPLVLTDSNGAVLVRVTPPGPPPPGPPGPLVPTAPQAPNP